MINCLKSSPFFKKAKKVKSPNFRTKNTGSENIAKSNHNHTHWLLRTKTVPSPLFTVYRIIIWTSITKLQSLTCAYINIYTKAEISWQSQTQISLNQFVYYSTKVTIS